MKKITTSLLLLAFTFCAFGIGAKDANAYYRGKKNKRFQLKWQANHFK